MTEYIWNEWDKYFCTVLYVLRAIYFQTTLFIHISNSKVLNILYSYFNINNKILEPRSR